MCIYCFFPLSYCSVVSPSAADAPVIDYFVDDRTSTVELTGKQSHSLPQISPIFPYFSCTRHMLLLLRYNPTQLHSLFLSPLDVPSVILCCLLYILYSAVNPAHC